MTRREKDFKRAILLLGSERFVSFLRAVRAEDDCGAVKFLNDELDRGNKLEDEFLTGDTFGYSLTVEQTGADQFLIAFGCQADFMLGDGGEWNVRFDPDGSVASFESISCWTS